MLADQVIHNRNFGRSLRDLCNDYLDIELPKELQKSDWAGELTDEQVEYARRDARVLIDLARSISAELRKLGLVKAVEIENSALPAIAWMEYMGVGFDLDSWQLLSNAAEGEVGSLKSALDQTLDDCLGETAVNWNSPKQITETLDRLGLAVADTKQETLEGVKGSHPIVPLLLDYREASSNGPVPTVSTG